MERTELKDLSSPVCVGSPCIWLPAGLSIRKSSFCSCLPWDTLSLRSLLLWPVSGVAQPMTVASVNSTCLVQPSASLGFPWECGELQFAGCCPSTSCVLKGFAEWLPARARGLGQGQRRNEEINSANAAVPHLIKGPGEAWTATAIIL